ncbi:hypothetical protein AB0C69_40710, partial [Actinomadura sp. NPDC048032]
APCRRGLLVAAGGDDEVLGARQHALGGEVDRLLAGTSLVRADGYRRAAQAARQGAVIAWDGTQAAGQVAGQAVRENAARLAQAESMQRALQSERARQMQDLGRRSAARMQDAVQSERAQQVGQAGKRVGGRLRNAYQDRRSARRQLPPQPEQPALPPPAPHYDPYAQPGYGQPGYGQPGQHEPPQQYMPPPQQ